MPAPALDAAGSDLLDAFERQLRHDPDADLADFLLAPGHPGRVTHLTEAVRLDMEYSHGRGVPRSPEHYLAAFPDLAADPAAVAALAFEDYRLRRLAGDAADPDEYARRFGVDAADWPLDPAADREPADPFLNDASTTPPPAARIDQLRTSVLNPPAARRAVEDLPTSGRPSASAAPAPDKGHTPSPVAMPAAGSQFLGFDLVEELGRGAFGRVFLARQGSLAGRLVAVKVGRGLFAESQTLAQLQHTNIVPIYSAHDAGGVQVVCMPYFGPCTLAHVLADIRARGVLPATGEHLVGTIRLGKTVTQPEAAGRPASSPDIALDAPARAGAAAREQAWARLAGLSYPDAVAWVGGQLAAGLAHAHARGIIHRDLKPANVLMTDDGVPMLLDFNIAEDTKARVPLNGAVVGGTLPYMAPEQIEAFAGAAVAVDGRADVYALGVILFEMLTGARPFPDHTGSHQEVTARMLADRQAGPPAVRDRNPAVSRAVEAVVRKCLATDAAARYASAHDLHDDLTRHLADLPLAHAPDPSPRERLGKWRRRHPRLASATSVGVVAVMLLAGTAAAAFATRERSRAFEARVTLADHARDLAALRAPLDDRNQTRDTLARGIEQSKAALARYGIPADADAALSGWDRTALVRYLPKDDAARLREDLGEVYYLMAKAAGRQAQLAADAPTRDARLADAARWNRLAAEFGAGRIPRAVREQRADLERLAGRPADADRAAAEAAGTEPGSPRDRYLFGYWQHHQGRHRQAAAALAAATDADPGSFSAWFVRGTNHLALEQNDLAAMCFTACVALRPDFAPGWVNRGIALVKLRKFDLALADYAAADRLAPGKADVHLLRGGALLAQGKDADAAAAFTAALACADCPPRAYFHRAAARRAADPAGAAADEADGLKRDPADELDWTARAEIRLAAGDARAALADVEGALRVNPLSLPGLQLKAHLLGERLGDAAGALTALDRAVELYPDAVPVRAGRAVHHARAGDRDRAVRDAEVALQLDTGGVNLYQVGCVYALTARAHPADRFRACELLAAALRAGFGAEHLPTDPDLDAIRATEEFKKLTPLR